MKFEKIDDWEIEDIGYVDDYVYDIETENHMFFANDILVHNSNYFDLSDVLDVYYKIKPDATRNEAADFMDKFCHKIEDDCLNPTFEHVYKEMNCHKNAMHMDREAISIPYRKTGYSSLWLAKKRYISMVTDMEGYRYEEPHAKIMGLESAKSTMPAWIKPYYNRALQDLIEFGVEEARNTVKKCKDEFFSKRIDEIAFPKSVSDVNKFMNPQTKLPWDGEWLDTDTNKTRNGGVPINSKAAINHNYLIDKLGLQKKYQYIKAGDHLKYVLLTENKYKFSVIAFHDELPKEFELDEFVDYQEHYNRVFLKPVSDAFEACGYTVEKRISIDDFF